MDTYGKAQNARQNGGTKQGDRYQNRIGRTHQEKGRDRCKLSSNCQISSYDQFMCFTFDFLFAFRVNHKKDARSLYHDVRAIWAPKTTHVYWIYRQKCPQKWSTPTYDVTIIPWIWFFFSTVFESCILLSLRWPYFNHSGMGFPL